MPMNKTRAMLLQTAGILALTSGVAFAQSNDATVANEAVVNDETVIDVPDGMVQNTNDAEISDTGVRVDSEATVRIVPSDSDTAQDTRPAGVNDETVPDIVDGTVSDVESQGPDGMIDLMADWKLSDYQGMTLISDTGTHVGTVETLAYDGGDEVYLVVDLSGDVNPIATGQRAIDLAYVEADTVRQVLVLDGLSVGTVEAMQPLDASMSGYTEVSTDAQLYELISETKVN